MVIVLAVQRFDMQGGAGGLGEGMEPFAEQFGVEIAQLGPAESTFHTTKGRFDRSSATRVKVSSMGISAWP